MKLKNKVLLAIGLVWATFLIVTYIGSRTLLLQTFLNLENDRNNHDLTRVDATLNQLSNELNTFASDWAHWNDLYAFMKGTNDSFISNNLNMTVYTNAKLNLISFWDKQDKLVTGVAIDLDNKKLIAIPSELQKYSYPGSFLLNTHNTNKSVEGFILVNNNIMLVHASPITDSEKKFPPLGTLIAGTTLTENKLHKIAYISQLDLTLFTVNQINNNPNVYTAWQKSIINSNHHYITPLNDSIMKSYTLISDVNGKPIGVIQVTSPRNIFLAGIKTIHYFMASFLTLGILFSLLMIWLLHLVIIKRLEKLDNEIENIVKNKNFSTRVQVEGNDELSSVETQINAMLTTITSSQDFLEQRVIDRTKELQKSNLKLQKEIVEREIIEKEFKLNRDHLTQLVHYDKLTELPNRVYFHEIIHNILSQAVRSNKIFAVLFIDLDKFKKINDALGHAAGDQVLKEMSKRFLSILRTGDFLARLGSDEFIVLLNDIKHSKYASPVAEKLLQACLNPIKIDLHDVYISASIGVCIYPNDGTAIEDLQRHSDMAMYKAKKSGGNAFHYFTKELDAEAHDYIRIETALRKAIKNKEFVFYYQPQFNLSDGKIHGVEALIRWNNPDIGIIDPDKFIPLAEETGLIMPIGEWTIEEACRVNKSWQDKGYEPISIAVNISAKQFCHQDIPGIISRALTDNGLEARFLEIEITETAVMDNIEITIKKLNDIKAMGVRISIDDFGTGYTSIGYLKKFPIDLIKIDRSFVSEVPKSTNDSAIINAIIAMGHNLGIKVLAEGVETREQYEYLVTQQCDLVQGYFLSRPEPVDKVILQFTKK